LTHLLNFLGGLEYDKVQNLAKGFFLFVNAVKFFWFLNWEFSPTYRLDEYLKCNKEIKGLLFNLPGMSEQ